MRMPSYIAKPCKVYMYRIDISKSLPQYECKFWKEDEDISGTAIVPICNRFIKA